MQQRGQAAAYGAKAKDTKPSPVSHENLVAAHESTHVGARRAAS